MNRRKLTPKCLKNMNQEELLATRICDLPVSLKNHWVGTCVSKLHKEISNKDLRFKPKVWISDDWFSPDGVVGFAVPFFILHPRLMELEKQMVGEVEGGDRDWCMKLMRHELGHAIDNAYLLRKNKRRQFLFGLTSKPYPKSYKPNKYSRNYVRHLEDHYAQAHPDEDWAETFATWLTPRSSWQKVYKDWPALKKLQLVDDIMGEIQGHRPVVANKESVDDLTDIKITLGEYYKEKRKRLGLNKRSPFKSDLKKIFSPQGEIPAWRFVSDSQGLIIGQVAKKTSLQQNKIKKMLREVQITCRQENLKVNKHLGESRKQLIELMTKKSEGFMKSGSPRIIM